MLCVTFKNPTHHSISLAGKEGDLIELYADQIHWPELKQFRGHCSKPVIFKLKSFDPQFLKLNPDYLDLPHTTPNEVWSTLASTHPRIKTICSYHDFERTPDLEPLLLSMRDCPAEIKKITTQSNSILDSLRMLELVKKYRCIGICMGELGKITRILSPIFGAPWTYAPLSEDQKTAPGQLLVDELTQIYQFRRYTSQTAIYGLIGNPTEKSPGHRMHNFAFHQLGVDAAYVKMDLLEEELGEFFRLCKKLGIKGLSVTMPLKEAVVPFLNHQRIKAINTIRFTPKGLLGWNTDGPGALDALEKKIKVKGKKIVLLGAGGAAHGIAHEAKQRGALVTILNRTLSRAEKLAREVGGEAFPLNRFKEVAREGYDILINCTPVGMGGELSLLVAEEEMLPGKVVMDVISEPPLTPFLEAAKKRGCTIIKGMEMFIRQAAHQYQQWFKNAE